MKPCKYINQIRHLLNDVTWDLDKPIETNDDAIEWLVELKVDLETKLKEPRNYT